MLWSLPAAIEGGDFSGPSKPGGLVYRMIEAGKKKPLSEDDNAKQAKDFA